MSLQQWVSEHPAVIVCNKLCEWFFHVLVTVYLAFAALIKWYWSVGREWHKNWEQVVTLIRLCEYPRDSEGLESQSCIMTTNLRNECDACSIKLTLLQCYNYYNFLWAFRWSVGKFGLLPSVLKLFCSGAGMSRSNEWRISKDKQNPMTLFSLCGLAGFTF